jgi:uncharacterized protein YndB with AHSA1/START domain
MIVLLVLSMPTAAGALVGPVAALAPVLGTWEVTTAWEGGSILWAQAQYSPGIGGRSVEVRVLVKEADNPPFVRYFNVLRYDKARAQWVVDSFTPDGNQSSMDFDFVDGVLTMAWNEGEGRIRDSSTLLGDDRMRWQVQFTGKGQEPVQLMDAVWKKIGDETMIKPIDTNLFAADSPTRSFVREVTIAAPVAEVYAAWSDGERFVQAYDPDRPELKANIDLAIGGRFEWLWDGKMGSNDCQVLSFIPDRMISFSWNAPPDQVDSRAKRTWVVVEFEATDSGGTHVRLSHLGFGSAAHWDETYEYFQAAWPVVFANFKQNLES